MPQELNKSLSRAEQDPPLSIAQWGWKYHHTGIPTNETRQGEHYITSIQCFVSGFSDSPFGIEWMRFEEESPVHPLVKAVPHIAFEVKDLDFELANHNLNIITPPVSSAAGIRVAMIEHNGAPVELIEFKTL